MWPFEKRVEEKKKLLGIVETGSPGARQGSVDAPRVVLVGSSDQAQQTYGSIRKTLLECRLIEASVNPATAAKVSTTISSTTVSGATYPEDFGDFQDYLDAFNYIPFVHRAVVVKHSLIWQMGYDLESEDDAAKQKVDELLVQLKADTVIRNGSLWALVFGNMYWQKLREGGVPRLRALNPAKMGVKLDAKDEISSYVYERKYGKRETFKPEEIIHLKVDDAPFELFGTSTLRSVLPTVKSMLYMEEKLPLIARRRADPLLAIQIGDKENPVDETAFKKKKAEILNRESGTDLFHDGIITNIQEVYQSASIGGRQTIEPLLKHFRESEVAGLGVPDVALGFGGTSTMATAEYQERLLEGEIRDYQRCLKRMHEADIFPLAGVEGVKLVWRPLKEADKFELSKKFCGEIEHGVLSPEWASKQLGYPDDARKDTFMNANLVAVGAPAAGKKPSEAERLRLKALRKMAGEKEDGQN